MTGQVVYGYQHCGMTVSSPLALPELADFAIPEAVNPDFTLAIGPVSPMAEAVSTWRTMRFAADGTVEWMLAGYGTMRVSGGRTLTIAPEPGVSDLALRSVMIGPAQALLWAQRGKIPMHASAVLNGDTALCISGRSGAGKSALAALLADQGLPVIADDFAVFESAGGFPRLLPGSTVLRLWDPVLAAIPAARAIEVAHRDGGKWIVRIGDPIVPPTSVAAGDIVLLAPRGEQFTIRSASGPELLANWRALIHLPQAMLALGMVPAIGAHLNALLKSGMRVWMVTMPADMAGARAACKLLLDTLAQPMEVGVSK